MPQPIFRDALKQLEEGVVLTPESPVDNKNDDAKAMINLNEEPQNLDLKDIESNNYAF